MHQLLFKQECTASEEPEPAPQPPTDPDHFGCKGYINKTGILFDTHVLNLVLCPWGVRNLPGCEGSPGEGIIYSLTVLPSALYKTLKTFN